MGLALQKKLHCIEESEKLDGCPLMHPQHACPGEKTKVVVLLVLLVWWLDIPKSEEAPYQVIEYFSGVGRIAGIAKRTGLKSAAVDIEQGEEYAKKRGKRTRSPMDINSNAGLVSPGIS